MLLSGTSIADWVELDVQSIEGSLGGRKVDMVSTFSSKEIALGEDMITGTIVVSFSSFILGESEKGFTKKGMEGIFHRLYSETCGL